MGYSAHRLYVLFLSFIFLAPLLHSRAGHTQIASAPAIDRIGISDTGTRPFGSYDGVLDHINLENNNMNLTIPLVTLPGRNHMDLKLALAYDSNIWRLQRKWDPNASPAWITEWITESKYPFVAIGWGLNWPSIAGSETPYFEEGYLQQLGACTGVSTAVLQDGSRHNFMNNWTCANYYGVDPSQVVEPVMDSEEADGMQLNCAYSGYSGCVLLEPNGTKIFFDSIPDGSAASEFGASAPPSQLASKIVDIDGNTITYNNGVITDTLGRQITFNANGVTYKDTNGTTQTIAYQFQNILVTAPPFPLQTVAWSVNTGYSSTFPLLTSVMINSSSTEPQTYSFGYNSYGQMNQIVYPHHGCTAYDYSQIAFEVSAPMPSPSGTSSGNAVLANSRGVHPQLLPPGSQPVLLYSQFPVVTAKHVSPKVSSSGQCNQNLATTTYTPSSNGYGANNDKMTVTLPDQSSEVHYFTQADMSGFESYHGVISQELEVDYIASNSTLLKKVEKTYSGPTSWDLPIVIKTTYQPNTSQAAVTQQNFTYGHCINVLYQPFVFTDAASVANPQQPTAQTISRCLNNATQTDTHDYGSSASGSVIQTVRTDYTDYNTGNPASRLLSLPLDSITYDGNQAFKVRYRYDEVAPSPVTAVQHVEPSYTQRGNLTSMSRCTDQSASTDPNTCSQWITTSSYRYDSTGNMVSMSDVLHTSTFGWTDANAWNQATCAQSGEANAYVSTVTNAKGQSVTAKYQSCSGQLASITDANNQLTSYTFDSIDRIKSESLPDGGSVGIGYDDGNNQATLTTAAAPNPNMVHRVTYDGIGRHTLTEILSDPSGSDITQLSYDGRDRLVFQSNPARGSASSVGTTSTYDGLGRVYSTTFADASTATTNYSAFPCVRITDEAGKVTSSCTDALGRIKTVHEDPDGLNYLTSYQYDANGNLTRVVKAGQADRVFTYDGLSRLVLSNNPETGAIAYSYLMGGNFCAGNVSLPCYKTDARGVTVGYSYDALNRLTNKQSSGAAGVPGFNFTYGYDAVNPAVANGIGRLLYTLNGQEETEQYWYDAMGRMTTQSVYLLSAPHTAVNTSAQYDLAGNMTDLTYPDGRHIKQTFDGAGRLQTSTLHDINGVAQSQSYLTSIMYNPDGSPQVTTLGNGVRQTSQENNRLQVQSMSAAFPIGSSTLQPVLSHTYCYVNCTTGGTANNGNIWGITDTLNGTRTQGFTYDNLNRIGSFTLGGALNQQYAIDSFGNLSGVVNGNAARTFDPATNRINNLPCAASVAAYDAAGNQLCDSDPYGAIRQYTFDAESRVSQIATINNSASPFVTYAYGADGDRVRKLNSDGTSTEYVNFGGQTIAEKDQTGAFTDYIFAGGKKIARVTQQYPRLDLRATGCGANTEQDWNYQLGAIQVAIGDRMMWREKHLNSQPSYLKVQFSNNVWIFDGATGAQNGAWQTASVDLSQWAGDTLWGTWIAEIADNNGAINTEIKDLVFVKSDGTIYQPLSTASSFGCSASSAVSENATDDVAANPAEATHFYLGDHLGTAQMEFAAGGWPIWQGQFAPFGAELDNQTTSNHYKFTGKERDTESGLDYFGARYYASNMGRWMSPDWSAQEEPVPYAKLDDPQSLNLYGYVGNNPLGKADPDGHDGVTDALKVGAGLEVVAPELTPAIVIGVGVVALGTVIADHWDSIKESFPSTGAGAGPYVGPNRETVALLNKNASSSAQPSNSSGGLPKPPTGAGSVPPDQRDPKRTYTKAETTKKLADQGGKCAQCGKPKGADDVVGHHKERHADGGRTNDANHAAVCKDCHVNDLHKP